MPVMIHGKEYVTVAERVAAAHNSSTLISITTEIIIEDGKRFIVKATVILTDDHQCFTGHAEEIRGSKGIAGQSPLEVAETSAVGRALGLAGFGSMESIASTDEVKAAQGRQVPPTPETTAQSKDGNGNGNGNNNDITRPADAATVKGWLAAKSEQLSHYSDPTPNQLGLMNGLLSKILGGDKERRSWLDWTWGSISSKEMPGNQVGATLNWLKPEKDAETNEYVPHPFAVSECKMMLRQAMLNKGQGDMFDDA